MSARFALASRAKTRGELENGGPSFEFDCFVGEICRQIRRAAKIPASAASSPPGASLEAAGPFDFDKDLDNPANPSKNLSTSLLNRSNLCYHRNWSNPLLEAARNWRFIPLDPGQFPPLKAGPTPVQSPQKLAKFPLKLVKFPFRNQPP